MALAPSTKDKDISRRRKILDITVTPSGNYVAGGDTLNLSAANVANPKFIGNGKLAGLPKTYQVLNSPAGYTAEIIAGATLATFKLKISTTAGAELAAGAYPAALLADPFVLRFAGALGSF